MTVSDVLGCKTNISNSNERIMFLVIYYNYNYHKSKVFYSNNDYHILG